MKKLDIELSQQGEFNRLLKGMDFSRYNESWNFLNLWMWWKPFNIKAVFGEDMIACVMEGEKDEWFLRPICKKEQVKEWFEFAKKIANSDVITISNAHDELIEAFRDSGVKVEIVKELAEYAEYFYEAEKLRTFSGKKLQKKRNLVNRFKATYEGRWEYRTLGESDKETVLKYMDKWEVEHVKDMEYFRMEVQTTKDVIKSVEKFNNIKFGGIFIDGELEGFSLAEQVSEDFLNTNIEKGNSEIVGLYQVLVAEFLKNEVPNVKYVSREDAADDDGLKKSKMSYRPIKVVEKYDIRISD